MTTQWKFSGDYKSAYFSPCEQYRYLLTRAGLGGKGICVFVGLNPSTATHEIDDPTIRRCINFTKAWGFETYVMLNAYGFRATDPKVMKAQHDPVGPENDGFLREYGQRASLVVAAWGTHCTHERAAKVREVIGRPIHCLGTNQDGSPKHPLYLRKDCKTVLWEPGKC